MSPTIENLFDQYFELTGSPEAAATLVLADVQSVERPPTNGYVRGVLTPPQAAEQLGVDPSTVIGWIRTGQLRASNIGKGGKRPRYRIRESDLDAFLKSRQPEPPVAKKRRSRQPAGEIEFFA